MHLLSARRRLAVVAMTPLLAGGLSACDSSGDGSAASVASPSRSASASAGSSAASAPSSAAGTVGRPVATAAFRRTLAHSLATTTTARLGLRFATSGMSLTGTGAVDYTGRTPALALSLDVPSLGGKADVRVVDQVMYVGLPMLDPGTFYRVDLSKPDGPLAQLGAITAFDPQTTLKRLSRSIRSVADDGPEELSGAAVRRYTVTVDSRRLQGPTASAAPQQQTAALPPTFTYDVWIDDAGRLHKVETAPRAGTDVVVTLSDWGRPVTIRTPPAASVKEMPEGGIS